MSDDSRSLDDLQDALGPDHDIRRELGRGSTAAVYQAWERDLGFGRLTDGTRYLVMREVKGRTMAERLETDGPLSPGLALPVLKDVASALAAAHAKSILHRDVRPAKNLFRRKNRRGPFSSTSAWLRS